MTQPEPQDALVEQIAAHLAGFNKPPQGAGLATQSMWQGSVNKARQLIPIIRANDAARIAELEARVREEQQCVEAFRAKTKKLSEAVQLLLHPLQEAADAMEANGAQLADNVGETLAFARATLRSSPDAG